MAKPIDLVKLFNIARHCRGLLKKVDDLEASPSGLNHILEFRKKFASLVQSMIILSHNDAIICNSYYFCMFLGRVLYDSNCNVAWYEIAKFTFHSNTMSSSSNRILLFLFESSYPRE